MSEPLTSNEIENVLSSIRRLVSSELRPSLKPPVNGPAVDKLLLTPSLRVVSDEAREAQAAGDAAGAPSMAQPGGEEMTELWSAGTEINADPEVFFGEAAPLGRTRGGEEYDDMGLAEGGNGLRVVIDSLAAATVPAGDDALRHQDDAGAESDRTLLASIPEVDWAEGGDAWAGEDVISYPAAPAAVAEPSAAPAAAAKPALSEEPLARAWADRAEAEITAELGREDTAPAGRAPVTVAEAALADSDDEIEDSWIDEELLRDLVRTIIREELAGTLGERITRNVRKLVRLELNRSLTSRDFE